MNQTPTHVLWIDLDGTVRHGFDELGYFVHKPEHVQIFDGVANILAAYKLAGWRIVGVTNQGGVALGHLTVEDVMSVNFQTHRMCHGLFDKITTHPSSRRARPDDGQLLVSQTPYWNARGFGY